MKSRDTLHTTIIRVDPIFKRELDEIKKLKIKVGAAEFMPSDRRITKAITNMDDWNIIKDRLIKAEFEDDRKKRK